jgi:hypothetical protein
VDKVYPKQNPSMIQLNKMINRLYKENFSELCKEEDDDSIKIIERMFEKMHTRGQGYDEDDDDEAAHHAH